MHDFSVYQLHVHGTLSPNALLDDGVALIQRELQSSTFHLIYQRQQLVAIFPASDLGRRDKATTVHYVDITPYPLSVPREGPRVIDEWRSLAARVRQSRQAISSYARFLNVTASPIGPSHPVVIYPYLRGILDDDGTVSFVGFDPEDFLDRAKTQHLRPFFEQSPSRQMHTFVVFPTVYSPALPGNAEQDLPFNEQLCAYLRRFPLRAGDTVWDIGTGSGWLTWLAWAASGGRSTALSFYASDINPLAIANARLNARLAGFPLTARLHDNIISPSGQPAFPGVRFNIVIWNMPAIALSFPDQTVEPSMFQYWDGAPEAMETLKIFARGLSSLLPFKAEPDRGCDSQSAAIVWNVIPKPGKDIVAETFAAAGLQVTHLSASTPHPMQPPSATYLVTAPGTPGRDRQPCGAEAPASKP